MYKLFFMKYLNIFFFLYSDNISLSVDYFCNKANSCRDICDYCSAHNIKIYIPNTMNIFKKININRFKKMISQYENLFATDEEIEDISKLFKEEKYYT